MCDEYLQEVMNHRTLLVKLTVLNRQESSCYGSSLARNDVLYITKMYKGTFFHYVLKRPVTIVFTFTLDDAFYKF
jgi:hypothetical protein